MHHRGTAQDPCSPYAQSNPARGYQGNKQQGTPMIVYAFGGIAVVCIVMVVAVFLVAPEGSSHEPDYDVDCAYEEEDCQQNSDCCSHLCLHHTCRCKDLDEICDVTANCCHGNCVHGKCVEEECLDGGEKCTHNDECCTQECNKGVCLSFDEAEECSDTGAKCKKDMDCCSFVCSKNICVDCMEKNGACSRNEECCNEECDKKVGRCKNCNPEGDDCVDHSDCCTNKCYDGYCHFPEYEHEEHKFEEPTEEEIKALEEEMQHMDVDTEEGEEGH